MQLPFIRVQLPFTRVQLPFIRVPFIGQVHRAVASDWSERCQLEL